MDTQVLLDKLAKAASFKFKEDKTAPGITVAVLKNGDYYCSVVRYDGAFAKGKMVVCSARADSLGQVLKIVAKDFLVKSSVVRDPVSDLDNFVRSV